MKVMTILGTRPEIIRLSRVIARLEETAVVDHVLVHTGQNYDYELNQVFFDDLGLRKPDHFLEADTSSIGHVYGDILIKSEEVMRSEQPDAVLILGDTNSAIAAIIAAVSTSPSSTWKQATAVSTGACQKKQTGASSITFPTSTSSTPNTPEQT